MKGKDMRYRDYTDDGRDDYEEADPTASSSAAASSAAVAPTPSGNGTAAASSAVAPAHSGNGTADGARPSLFCRFCKNTGGRFFLACESPTDWQGGLDCICKGCFDRHGSNAAEPEWDFATFQQKSWVRRKKNAAQHKRVMCFKKAAMEIPNDAGLSAREFRKKLMNNAKAFAKDMVCGILKLPPAQQQMIVSAMDKWAECIEKIIAEPGWVPDLMVCGNIMEHELADYAHELMTGVSDYYLCRVANDPLDLLYRPCGFFSIADNWARSVQVDVRTASTPLGEGGSSASTPLGEGGSAGDADAGGHYRCPLCAGHYRPWAGSSRSGGKLIEANKILVVATNPEKVKYLPFMWGDTKTQSLMNRFKEVMMGMTGEVNNLGPVQLWERVKESALRTAMQYDYWQQFEVTTHTKQHLAGLAEKYYIDHIPTPFIGSRYRMKEGEKGLSQDELARTFAYIRVVSKQALALQAKTKRGGAP